MHTLSISCTAFATQTLIPLKVHVYVMCMLSNLVS